MAARKTLARFHVLALATTGRSPAKKSLPGSSVPRAWLSAHSAIWAAMTL